MLAIDIEEIIKNIDLGKINLFTLIEDYENKLVVEESLLELKGEIESLTGDLECNDDVISDLRNDVENLRNVIQNFLSISNDLKTEARKYL